MKAKRHIGVIVIFAVIFVVLWWLYDMEFHYSNTDAGRLAAVEEYIPQPEESTISHGVEAGTPVRAVSWQTIKNRLFVFYKADNEENVHGILHLVRGINGKYRAVEADMNPSPYVAGVYGDSLTPKGTDWKLFSLAGDNCHNIYAVEVCYAVVDQSGMDLIRASETYDITEANFLWIMDQENVVEELGFDDTEVARLYVDEIRMLDKDGNDITDQYKDDSVTASWNAGISTAEMFLLYVYMGIVAFLGLILVRFYLRRD